MTTDPKSADRRPRLSLLAQEDVARIERGLTAGESGSLLTGLVEDPPPYDPGARKKLPSWAKHLRDLRPLKLAE